MKPSMLYEALLALIGERVPLHIWNPCGVGKSQIAAQARFCRDMAGRADCASDACTIALVSPYRLIGEAQEP
jgi:hypothetical protein